MFNRYPAARYRMTQLAFVQEHALAEAQNRIQRLEWELQQAQQAAQQAQEQQRNGGASGGFFSGLFGGGSRSARRTAAGWAGTGLEPARAAAGLSAGRAAAGLAPNYQQGGPPPQYAPSYQPGMFQRSGSGFLGSALTTAAGVAGGLVAGNALMSLFSGSHSFGGGGFGGAAAGGGPWGGGAQADQGYVDQGTWTDPAGGGSADPGYVDSGTWDTSSNDPSPPTTAAAIPAGTGRRRVDRRYVLSRTADRAVTRVSRGCRHQSSRRRHRGPAMTPKSTWRASAEGVLRSLSSWSFARKACPREGNHHSLFQGAIQNALQRCVAPQPCRRDMSAVGDPLALGFFPVAAVKEPRRLEAGPSISSRHLAFTVILSGWERGT